MPKKIYAHKHHTDDIKPIMEWQMSILWITDYVKKCKKQAEMNPLLNYREWTITNALHNEKN